jgi:hypothetical protein
MDARTFVKVENVNFNAEEPTNENMSKGWLGMLKQWNVLAKNLAAIHGDISSTNKRDVRFKEELVDTFLRVETKIKETDTRMKLLISGVGSDSTASKRGSNSVWSSIKVLQEDMKALELQMTLMYERLSGDADETHRIDKLEVEREIGVKRLSGLEGREKAHETKLIQLNANYKALDEHYGQSMEEVSRAIRKLNNGQKVQSVQFENPMGKARDEDSLRTDHKWLKNVAEETKNGQSQCSGGATSGWKPELESLKRKLADLEGNSGQMFSHKRLTFRTKQDVKAWVVANSVALPGMYWD